MTPEGIRTVQRLHRQTPRSQRVRIAGTIEMTDAVIAEKDREILNLKAQLMESASGAGENSQSQKITELVDADEVIAEHRERIASARVIFHSTGTQWVEFRVDRKILLRKTGVMTHHIHL